MINKIFFKASFLIIWAVAVPEPALTQTLNYPEIFGDDWNKAVSFLEKNDYWIKRVLDKSHIPYHFAVAIIFPELIRYSALRDKMEITLLKTLYINIGEDYADFSIGPFQMKPSFAEAVRERAPMAMGRKAKIIFREKGEYADVRQYRTAIINDLEDPASQLNYLIAFIMICDKDFKGNWSDEISRLKFFSTAYNTGINRRPEEINALTGKKFFNTKIFKTENYCYSDVALYWYMSRK